MSATTTMSISPFQAIAKTVGWSLRFVVLVVLYFALLALGGQIVGPYMPALTTAEPGPLPLMTALWISCTAITLVIMLMINSSGWYGWKLILSMSVAYYLLVTVVTQLEAWYFLYGVTIGPELMWRLFLQGMPVAFIFVPLAVIVMGRVRPLERATESPKIASMPLKEWLWKLGIVYIAYLVVYYLAGYFIAWQNPEVRAFYGSPGDALPFFEQMVHIFSTDPWLTPYQLLRTLLWVAGALFIIRGSRLSLWQTALIVGLMLSVPQNIGHLIPNPMIPLNSVRISHMIETASSTFIFGLIVAWFLYPKYKTSKS
ncbi:MAG: hypothetical protein ACXW4U_05120 [Anaerolineales bacterium]